MDMWSANLSHALALQIPHISSYCLTIEEKTALHHQVKTGQSIAPDQDKANAQFANLMETLTSEGYDHYEISNFAKPGHYAIHNTNYWKGAHYLGIGPSAHGYDGISRSWNVANNKKYIDQIKDGQLPLEYETLTPEMRYNEYVMTGLRTIWGIGLEEICQFGQAFGDYFLLEIAKDISSGMVHTDGERYYLTQSGKFFADRIAMDLFMV
jgi:oxygen-independent coproporphyrinogen-3 oxidase